MDRTELEGEFAWFRVPRATKISPKLLMGEHIGSLMQDAYCIIIMLSAMFIRLLLLRPDEPVSIRSFKGKVPKQPGA